VIPPSFRPDALRAICVGFVLQQGAIIGGIVLPGTVVSPGRIAGDRNNLGLIR
jgi:hypothetical protein